MTDAGADSVLGSAAARPRPARQIGAATYNIHRCVGTDGRYSPGRIALVLEELDADIIGLQEVDTRLTAAGGRDQLSFLAHRLGFYVAAGLNIVRHRGHYGNALLSRWPILNSLLIDLTAPGREPRGAVSGDIAAPETSASIGLRVIITHFGLRAWERRRQLTGLLEYIGLDAGDERPLLVMGDFNEWIRFGRSRAA